MYEETRWLDAANIGGSTELDLVNINLHYIVLEELDGRSHTSADVHEGKPVICTTTQARRIVELLQEAIRVAESGEMKRFGGELH